MYADGVGLVVYTFETYIRNYFTTDGTADKTSDIS